MPSGIIKKYIDKHKWLFCMGSCFAILLCLFIFAMQYYPPLYANGFAKNSDEPFVESYRQEDEINRLCINTADIIELCALPGIGEARAQAIVQWRDTYGAFESYEDLLNVKGIGEKVLEDIKQYIYF